MRPLIFLFTRSFINGVRRSLLSPKRAVGLVFFGCYYYFLLIRSFVPTSDGISIIPVANRFEMPDPNIIRGVVFLLFALASIFLMPGVVPIRGGFKPPDVDVLFPTPVEPKTVLIFRILRDYLLTLIAPLLLGLLGWRGTSLGFTALIHNYPVHSMNMMRSVWLSWMLMSFGWISLSYGLSLFVGRSDLRSDGNQRTIQFGTQGAVLVAVCFIGQALHQNLSWKTALDLTHSTVLEVIFLPATIATDLTMGSLDGNFILIGVALFGLLSIIGLGLALALTQVSWLYDQAAAKGFTAPLLRRNRNVNYQYQIAAERARKGKSGRQIISKKLSHFSTSGPMGLIWKEQLMQLRGPMAGSVVTMIIILSVYAGLAYVVLDKGIARTFPSFAVGLPCVCAYFLATMNGFGGFGEMLKKVDVLKPLPFSSGRIIFFEILAKAPIPAVMLLGGTLEYCIIVPSAILTTLAGFLLSLAVLLVITSAILLAFVLFPDFEDPTQRGLGGIVMLIAEVICSSPGLAVYLVLTGYFGLPAWLCAIPSSALLILISVAVAKVSGLIYADYNPSE